MIFGYFFGGPGIKKGPGKMSSRQNRIVKEDMSSALRCGPGFAQCCISTFSYQVTWHALRGAVVFTCVIFIFTRAHLRDGNALRRGPGFAQRCISTFPIGSPGTLLVAVLVYSSEEMNAAV